MEACFAAFCSNWCQTKPALRGGGCFSCCGSSSNSDIFDEVEREQRAKKLGRTESEKRSEHGSIGSASDRFRRASQAGEPEYENGQTNGQAMGGDSQGAEGWRNTVENRARRSRSWSGEFDESDERTKRPSVEMPIPQRTSSPAMYQPSAQVPMSIPYPAPIDIPDITAASFVPPSLRPGGSFVSSPGVICSSPIGTPDPSIHPPYAPYADIGPIADMPAYPLPSHAPTHVHSRGRFGSRDGTAEFCPEEAVDLGMPTSMYKDNGVGIGGMDADLGVGAGGGAELYSQPRPPWQFERRYSLDGSEIGVVVDEKRLLGS